METRSLPENQVIQEGPARLQTLLSKEAGVRRLQRKESPLDSENHVPSVKAVPSLMLWPCCFPPVQLTLLGMVCVLDMSCAAQAFRTPWSAC